MYDDSPTKINLTQTCTCIATIHRQSPSDRDVQLVSVENLNCMGDKKNNNKKGYGLMFFKYTFCTCAGTVYR